MSYEDDDEDAVFGCFGYLFGGLALLVGIFSCMVNCYSGQNIHRELHNSSHSVQIERGFGEDYTSSLEGAVRYVEKIKERERISQVRDKQTSSTLELNAKYATMMSQREKDRKK